MPQDREAIPRDLERALFVEAGYRCAIPTCRAVQPLQIDHIEDYAKVREHKFENMIVLCANCHGLKGEKPRQLNRAALRQYKANLGLLNYRYGEFERKLLEDFGENPKPNIRIIPASMAVMFRSLLKDGYLTLHDASFESGAGGQFTMLTDDDGTVTYIPHEQAVSLTEAGAKFVRDWLAARPLPM